MKNNQPYFSIIIPTYNRGEFIKTSLQSILDQTYGNFEVIVVDDGSTDNTQQIVQSYSDPRIRYVYQVNKERAAARNNGIAHSLGEYITFLDSDDLFLAHHLQTVKDNLERLSHPPFFHQSYRIETVDGKIIARSWKNKKNPIIRLLVEGNYLSCAGVFLSKDVVEKYRFDEDRILSGSEDYELWLRIAITYNLVVDKNETSVMLNHDNRGELKMDKNNLVNRVEYLLNKKLHDEAFCKKYRHWLNRFKASSLSFVALHLAICNDRKKACRYLIRSIIASPLHLFSTRFLVIIKKLL